MVTLCAFALLLGAMPACSGGNSLSGSISESFDLSFDEVRIRKQDEVLLIEYIKLLHNGTAKPVKVVLEGRLLVDHAGQRIPLVDGLFVDNDHFAKAVTVSRIVTTGANFPSIEYGEMGFGDLNFNSLGVVSGHFDVIFNGGRTLTGTFYGALQEVDLR